MQITTLSIFKYTNFSSKIWAFGMMQFAHQHLKKAGGCSFYKLMGSGKEGFNPFPDWGIYSLLQVWETQAAAEEFIHHSTLFKKYFKNSSEHSILFMNSIQARGNWGGENPFISQNEELTNQKIAVITRASIKWSKLVTFWKFVPKSQKPLINAKGLLYTKGFGEVPFKEMATFSIWESKEDLFKFAYQSKEHIEAIKKTRTIKWYNEEMFSRFIITKINGDFLNF